jgi:hypothetical protein
MERRKFLAGVLSLPIIAALSKRFVPKAEAIEPVVTITAPGCSGLFKDALALRVGTNFFVTEQWQRFSWMQGDYLWSMYAKAIPTKGPVLIQHFCSPEMFDIPKSAIQYTTEAWQLITWSHMCEYMPGMKPYIQAHKASERALEHSDKYPPLLFTMPNGEKQAFTTRQLTVGPQLDCSSFYKMEFTEEAL